MDSSAKQLTSMRKEKVTVGANFDVDAHDQFRGTKQQQARQRFLLRVVFQRLHLLRVVCALHKTERQRLVQWAVSCLVPDPPVELVQCAVER